ncbi:hypothetical protein LCGC14_1178720 [marine sediment metagenome]|uniref:Chitin-binding type-3 domain-containing protein n=1 Tax=marine sediment metagenome TaxID=412755 RepID=A0A0F9P5R7_9ZZZZ|nr:hypothetical protein [Pricia sp.]
MALPDIVFNRGEGGLGRPLPGKDHLSAMLFYTAGSLPSGFGTSDRIKKIFSLQEAENLGIVDDHSDETKGTGGKVVIGGTWLAGETATISIDGGVLGTFTVLTGAAAISDVVAGLVAAINAGTATGIKHGWVATDVGGTDVELVQPDKLGIVNNAGAHITFTVTSVAGTGTPTQFTSGVGSYFAVLHYHISEYFREQPKGVTWVGIFAQAAYTGAEIETIQNFSNGEIRELGIYLSHEVFASSQLTASQGFLDTLQTEHKPLSVVFHSDLSSATLSTLADLTTLSNERVSMLIGEEGDYHQPAYSNTKAYLSGEKVTFQGKAYISKAATTGNAPWDATKWTELRENLQAISGFSIGTMGTTLGDVSFAKVNENIGWVAKFNVVSGTGLDEVAFATGDLFKDIATSLKDTLNDFHYIFLRKIQGISGTFNSDSFTAIIATSDFATIENNRTMDKAVRNIRTNVLPNLNSPLFVNDDGTLSEDTISLFKNDSQRALVDMVADGELSAQSVSIDPSQDVLSTSKIVISVILVPVGVARQIEFNIGFAVKLS